MSDTTTNAVGSDSVQGGVTHSYRSGYTVCRQLAVLVQARLNCIKAGNDVWLDKHETAIVQLVQDTAPSGSGIDCGTRIDLDASTGDKLVFTFSYHHMNDGGCYDGWTEHKCVVTPSLTCSFDVRITGRDRNEIKDYLHEVYSMWLGQTVQE